jgi:DNA-binding NtrC family response regulator
MNPPHILVVDDHREIRQAVGQIVERDGYRVSTAGNAT